MNIEENNKINRLEYLAHIYAFTKEGTFFWENYLIEKYRLEQKYNIKINPNY